MSMRAEKPKKTVCPLCGMMGYGPYVEVIRRGGSGALEVRAQIVHKLKIGKNWITFRTCYLPRPMRPHDQ